MKQWLSAFALVALIGVGVAWWMLRVPADLVGEADTPLDIAGEMGSRSITLFFGNSDGDALVSETRSIQATIHRDEEVEVVVGELLSGPTRRGAIRSFPADTRLRDVFYDEEERLLYLDFNQALVGVAMGGSSMETMTVGALLRTIAVCFPEVVAVQFLIDGLEVETLGGSLDLTRPLRTGDWL